MLTSRLFCAGALLLSSWASYAQKPLKKDEVLLFAYFKGNGEDGLHLATSPDGLQWSALNQDKSLLTPTVSKDKLMRDPCIIRGRDGQFHMVWTTSWTGGTIGHASSRDLVTWSAQQAVPVMAAFPGTRNTWAPDLLRDPKTGRFTIVWASTRGTAAGKEGDHRLYATDTVDFRRFSPTRLFYDPGFSVIDATFLNRDGRTIMFVKDERKEPLRKVIQWCELSPDHRRFGPLSPPITPAWTEGPTAIDVDGETVLFFDRYTDKKYGAVASRDLVTWRDISDRIAMPPGANHGTIIPIDRARHAALAALG